MDENRCSHAHLNPLLGIPTQAIKMMNYVANHVNTPNLFRQTQVPLPQQPQWHRSILDLRQSVEEEKGCGSLPLP